MTEAQQPPNQFTVKSSKKLTKAAQEKVDRMKAEKDRFYAKNNPQKKISLTGEQKMRQLGIGESKEAVHNTTLLPSPDTISKRSHTFYETELQDVKKLRQKLIQEQKDQTIGGVFYSKDQLDDNKRTILERGLFNNAQAKMQKIYHSVGKHRRAYSKGRNNKFCRYNRASRFDDNGKKVFGPSGRVNLKKIPEPEDIKNYTPEDAILTMAKTMYGQGKLFQILLDKAGYKPKSRDQRFWEMYVRDKAEWGRSCFANTIVGINKFSGRGAIFGEEHLKNQRNFSLNRAYSTKGYMTKAGAQEWVITVKIGKDDNWMNTVKMITWEGKTRKDIIREYKNLRLGWNGFTLKKSIDPIEGTEVIHHMIEYMRNKNVKFRIWPTSVFQAVQPEAKVTFEEVLQAAAETKFQKLNEDLLFVEINRVRKKIKGAFSKIFSNQNGPEVSDLRYWVSDEWREYVKTKVLRFPEVFMLGQPRWKAVGHKDYHHKYITNHFIANFPLMLPVILALSIVSIAALTTHYLPRILHKTHPYFIDIWRSYHTDEFPLGSLDQLQGYVRPNKPVIALAGFNLSQGLGRNFIKSFTRSWKKASKDVDRCNDKFVDFIRNPLFASQIGFLLPDAQLDVFAVDVLKIDKLPVGELGSSYNADYTASPRKQNMIFRKINLSEMDLTIKQAWKLFKRSGLPFMQGEPERMIFLRNPLAGSVTFPHVSNRQIKIQNKFVRHHKTMFTRFPTADPKTFAKNCKRFYGKIKSLSRWTAVDLTIEEFFSRSKIRKLVGLEGSTFAQKAIHVEIYDAKSLKLISKFHPSTDMLQVQRALRESSLLVHIYDPTPFVQLPKYPITIEVSRRTLRSKAGNIFRNKKRAYSNSNEDKDKDFSKNSSLTKEAIVEMLENKENKFPFIPTSNELRFPDNIADYTDKMLHPNDDLKRDRLTMYKWSQKYLRLKKNYAHTFSLIDVAKEYVELIIKSFYLRYSYQDQGFFVQIKEGDNSFYEKLVENQKDLQEKIPDMIREKDLLNEKVKLLKNQERSIFEDNRIDPKARFYKSSELKDLEKALKSIKEKITTENQKLIDYISEHENTLNRLIENQISQLEVEIKKAGSIFNHAFQEQINNPANNIKIKSKLKKEKANLQRIVAFKIEEILTSTQPFSNLFNRGKDQSDASKRLSTKERKKEISILKKSTSPFNLYFDEKNIAKVRIEKDALISFDFWKKRYFKTKFQNVAQAFADPAPISLDDAIPPKSLNITILKRIENTFFESPTKVFLKWASESEEDAKVDIIGEDLDDGSEDEKMVDTSADDDESDDFNASFEFTKETSQTIPSKSVSSLIDALIHNFQQTSISDDSLQSSWITLEANMISLIKTSIIAQLDTLPVQNRDLQFIHFSSVSHFLDKWTTLCETFASTKKKTIKISDELKDHLSGFNFAHLEGFWNEGFFNIIAKNTSQFRSGVHFDKRNVPDSSSKAIRIQKFEAYINLHIEKIKRILHISTKLFLERNSFPSISYHKMMGFNELINSILFTLKHFSKQAHRISKKNCKD